jgi:hypothetical protein
VLHLRVRVVLGAADALELGLIDIYGIKGWFLLIFMVFRGWVYSYSIDRGGCKHICRMGVRVNGKG